MTYNVPPLSSCPLTSLEFVCETKSCPSNEVLTPSNFWTPLLDSRPYLPHIKTKTTKPSSQKKSYFPYYLLDIFYTDHQSSSDYMPLIKKTWALLSDTQVAIKLQKHAVTKTSIGNFVPHHTHSSLHDIIPRINHLSISTLNHVYWTGFTSRPTAHEPVKDFFSGSFPIEACGKKTSAMFYALSSHHHNPLCSEFIKTHFSSILTSTFTDFSNCIKAPSFQTSITWRSYIWNALHLSIIKLQELWTHHAFENQQTNRDYFISAASLTCILFIDSEIWTVSIGNNKALVLSEKENSVWNLCKSMTFANHSLARKFELLGGTIAYPKWKMFPNIPLPLVAKSSGVPLNIPPRSIGPVYTFGINPNPIITKIDRLKKEPFVFVLGTHNF